jgi:hypothetical protein
MMLDLTPVYSAPDPGLLRRRFRSSWIRSTVHCHNSPLEEEGRELNRQLFTIDAQHSNAPDRLQRAPPAFAGR